MAWLDGTRAIAGLAHQNEAWPANSPDRIRESIASLNSRLAELDISLTVHPTGEVMVRPELPEDWEQGQLLTVADGDKYILLEMPNGLFVDIGHLIHYFVRAGVRPILAHPERNPELLEQNGIMESWIESGCLMQVNSGSIVDLRAAGQRKALRRWFERGMVHLLGSDGHSTRNRKPVMAEAVDRLRNWVGEDSARRIAISNGMAVLKGRPIVVPRPAPPRGNWLTKLWR